MLVILFLHLCLNSVDFTSVNSGQKVVKILHFSLLLVCACLHSSSKNGVPCFQSCPTWKGYMSCPVQVQFALPEYIVTTCLSIVLKYF